MTRSLPRRWLSYGGCLERGRQLGWTLAIGQLDLRELQSRLCYDPDLIALQIYDDNRKLSETFFISSRINGTRSRHLH